MYINHVNYANEIGNVYCCLRNKVVELNQFQIDNFCSGCKMFKGGMKVECCVTGKISDK